MNSESIKKIEEHYNVSYVGYYDLPDRDGPFYIFYQEKPNTELGHSHYMGLTFAMGSHGMGAYVFNAKSITDATFNAIFVNGNFLCSRFRHDYREDGDAMVDGGLAYCRTNRPITHTMKIIDGKEVFTPIEENKNAS